jgi:hypothetical protein
MKNEMGFHQIIEILNSGDSKIRNTCEFSFLGVDLSITNPNPEFMRILKSEYAYYMEPLRNKISIKINLIKIDTAPITPLFANAKEIVLHSTEIKNIITVVGNWS